MTLFLALTSLFAHADEGMWLPEQIPALAAQYPDLEMDPATLADPMGPVLGSRGELRGMHRQLCQRRWAHCDQSPLRRGVFTEHL